MALSCDSFRIDPFDQLSGLSETIADLQVLKWLVDSRNVRLIRMHSQLALASFDRYAFGELLQEFPARIDAIEII